MLGVISAVEVVIFKSSIWPRLFKQALYNFVCVRDRAVCSTVAFCMIKFTKNSWGFQVGRDVAGSREPD